MYGRSVRTGRNSPLAVPFYTHLCLQDDCNFDTNWQNVKFYYKHFIGFMLAITNTDIVYFPHMFEGTYQINITFLWLVLRPVNANNHIGKSTTNRRPLEHKLRAPTVDALGKSVISSPQFYCQRWLLPGDV